MQIILRVKTQFFLRDKAQDANGVQLPTVLNTVVLNPSNLPQVAPDWIKEDALFNLLVMDGTLVQIPEQVTKPAAVEPVDTANSGDESQDRGSETSSK
ncbi:MAG TPA: hypothetical protein VGR47_20260 [Terracidiphilus sp.]|nr:hypothetical protein [Terracidiphilus sp.]